MPAWTCATSSEQNFERARQLAKQDIPHGHGKAHKMGVSDGLLDIDQFEAEIDPTRRASYRRGFEEGVTLRAEIAARVKPRVLE